MRMLAIPIVVDNYQPQRLHGQNRARSIDCGTCVVAEFDEKTKHKTEKV